MKIIFDELAEFLKSGVLAIFIKKFPGIAPDESIVILSGFVLVSMDTDNIATTMVKIKIGGEVTLDVLLSSLKNWRVCKGVVMGEGDDYVVNNPVATYETIKTIDELNSIIESSTEMLKAERQDREAIKRSFSNREKNRKKTLPPTGLTPADEIKRNMKARKFKKLSGFPPGMPPTPPS